MLTEVCQRWRDQRGVYRPAREVIDPSAYEVAKMANHVDVKTFVCANHYSGSVSSPRFCYGLYWGGLLVGVAMFGMPMHKNVLTNRLPCDYLEGVELGRLVLLDMVPGNGESWMLARCFELLRREGIRGVVSFSDPHRRLASDGTIVLRGHLGVVYQSCNFLYTGQASANSILLLPDGKVFSRRCISKISTHDNGWNYSAKILERYGADPLPEDGDGKAWLTKWLPALTRAERHPGNLVYCLGLDRVTKKLLPKKVTPQPYPKFSPGGIVATVREPKLVRVAA